MPVARACSAFAAKRIRLFFVVSLALFLSVQLAPTAFGQFMPTFQHTPLPDGNDAWGANGLYKGLYPGLLYGHWNDGFATSLAEGNATHDTDGKNIAAGLVPLCQDGTTNCDLRGRKMVVLAIGFSNWTKEICGEQFPNIQADPQGLAQLTGGNTYADCPGNGWSLINKATLNPDVAEAYWSNRLIVNCAIKGAIAQYWLTDNPVTVIDNPPPLGLYSNCTWILRNLGLSELQVQVVLFKDADSGIVSPSWKELPPNNTPPPPIGPCFNSTPTPSGDPDACVLIYRVAKIARLIKSKKYDNTIPGYFPNTKMMFVHSRIYGGYADPADYHGPAPARDERLNPEPFAYEQGFAMRWLIQSQIDEILSPTGTPGLAAAGPLEYRSTNGHVPKAPWIDWGPYLWAGQGGMGPNSPHPAPCQNCEIPGLYWEQDVEGFNRACNGNQGEICNFQKSDDTHPSQCGRHKVAQMLMHFYCRSPYAYPWFAVQQPGQPLQACPNNALIDNSCGGYPQGPD
jgi:hypothetical protein